MPAPRLLCNLLLLLLSRCWMLRHCSRILTVSLRCISATLQRCRLLPWLLLLRRRQQQLRRLLGLHFNTTLLFQALSSCRPSSLPKLLRLLTACSISLLLLLLLLLLPLSQQLPELCWLLDWRRQRGRHRRSA
jgi:hypothetical protein